MNLTQLLMSLYNHDLLVIDDEGGAQLHPIATLAIRGHAERQRCGIDHQSDERVQDVIANTDAYHIVLEHHMNNAIPQAVGGGL